MTKLKVFCARSMTHAVNKLVTEFTRETGHQIDVTFGPVGTLQAKLAAGETADVLILGAPAMALMESQGCFVAGTRTDVARVSIGVAVRDGTPAPDISSAESFRTALLHARAIAFTDASVGGTAAVYLPQLFKRMEIADEIASKGRPQQSGAAVAECVASGEADIGITLIPEFLPIKGARVIGNLPPALAGDTIYSAAVSAHSAAPAEAAAFIAALTRPATREVWRVAGFERSDDGGQTREDR
jgi:molybdate transport system substrate-binding protein